MSPVMRLSLCALCAAALAGCARFPELDSVGRGSSTGLDYPAILPLDELLAQAAAPGPSYQAALAARTAALQARADALRSLP